MTLVRDIRLQKVAKEHNSERTTQNIHGGGLQPSSHRDSLESVGSNRGRRRFRSQNSGMFTVNEKASSLSSTASAARATVSKLGAAAGSAANALTSRISQARGRKHSSNSEEADTNISIEMAEIGNRNQQDNLDGDTWQSEIKEEERLETTLENSTESLQIAAYAHLQQWVSNAELCHRVLRAKVKLEQEESSEVEVRVLFDTFFMVPCCYINTFLNIFLMPQICYLFIL